MRNERFDFLHLPNRFHNNHKTCEFLLYQIEDFITKDDFKKLRIQTIQLDEKPKFENGEEFLEYLIRTNKHKEHDEIITSHILNSLIADICYFLQIALFSSLQKRLTVAFALIRKPFVYNLLIILRLYFTEDFLHRFNTQEGFDTTNLSKEEILQLLELSEHALISKPIKGSDIYDYVYNQSKDDSIINISNKALHPTTTRNKYNRTEIQNINLVFSSPSSIETQWDYLYRRLPLLLMYMNEIIEFIIFQHLEIDEKVYINRLRERAEVLKKYNAR